MPCFFIRLAGCNLRCSYCDAKYTYEEEGVEQTLEELLEEKAREYEVSRSTYALPIRDRSDLKEISKVLKRGVTDVYIMRRDFPKYFMKDDLEKKDSLEIRDLVSLVIDYVKQLERPSQPKLKLKRLTKYLDNITAYHNGVIKSGDEKGKDIGTVVAGSATVDAPAIT